MKKKPALKRPYNDNGVLKAAFETEFDVMVAKVREISAPMVGTMTFRDLYEFMRDAAITAVGNQLCDLVNSRPIVPKKKRKKK